MAPLVKPDTAVGTARLFRKRKLQRTVRSLLTSPCSPCRKRLLFKFLHQRRALHRRTPRMAIKRNPTAEPAAQVPPIQASKVRVLQAPNSSHIAQMPPSKEQVDARTKVVTGKSPQASTASSAQSEVSRPLVNGTPPSTPALHIKDLTPRHKTNAISDSATNGKPQVKASIPPKAKAAATPSGITKTWPARVGTAKVRGLHNPHQWCYRRSLLQAMFCVPQFFNLLNLHTNCKFQSCVSCALGRAVQSYQLGSKDLDRSISTLDASIKATGRKSDPPWRAIGGTQEDSHDFLQYLLGTVEKAAGISKSGFSDTYHVAHQSIWTCDRCKKTHTHIDQPSYSLSLPISPSNGRPATLSSCLQNYHHEPRLTIRCDGCKSNIPRTRTRLIRHAPGALYIQLGRFGYTARGGTGKNRKAVNFPERFDLAEWCVDRTQPAKYRLTAVVAHGGNLRMGHYKAYVRVGDVVTQANDETTTKVRSEEWRRPAGAFDPYILLYLKD